MHVCMCSNLLITYYTSLRRGQLCIIIIYRKLKRAIKAKSSLCVYLMFICTMFGKVWTDNHQVGHKTGDVDMFDKCDQVYLDYIHCS